MTMSGMPPSHRWPARRPTWLAGAWVSAWAALLLIPSVHAVGGSGRPALAAVGVVVVAVLFGVLTWPALAFRGLRPRAGARLVLLAALTAVATALAADLGVGALPLLVAIAVGVTAPVRWAPWLVVVLAAGASSLAGAEGDGWSQALWGTGMTTLLAGLLTVAFGWLGQVISELEETREELAQLAVGEERDRFARDLHDLLGHTLSLIVVKAQVARRAAGTDPAAVAQHAADIEEIGRDALTEVRAAARGYRAPTLDTELARAARSLRLAGVEADVVRGHGALSPAEDEMLGWVVREGVTNVIRHAGARHTRITTVTDSTGTRVLVEDDGVGPEGGGDDGSGLLGLRERAQRAGGRLEVSGDGAGFRLTAVVPVATVGER